MNYDFDVIARSWEYLFKEGMTFTLTLTALSILVARYKVVFEKQTWMGKPGNAWKLFWRGAWGVWCAWW
jgi:hypothetical protein